MNPKTTVLGIKAQHMIIGDSCRDAHGGLLEALDEAYCRMRDAVQSQYEKHWPHGRDDRFNLVLTADLAQSRDGEGD
jgi:hypothetical protein